MASHHPPTRVLSQRRGSMAAPDPFLQHETNSAVSSSSRITIVRLPSVKDQTPPSPGTRPRDGLPRTSDREPSSMARRSSWGSAKSGSSEGSSGRGKGRMSFAFATFTPIEPPSATVDRFGISAPHGSGSSSPVSFKDRSRANSNPSMDSIPPNRAANLTPQQLYEVAQQATNPGKTSPSTPVYGYGGLAFAATPAQHHDEGLQAAPFIPLPSEVYLPFIQRPQEVSHLLSTPQTGRLFALLASTFPQETAAASLSRPSSSMSIRAQDTGGSSNTNHLVFSDIPEDSKSWTFRELTAWLKYVTRQEANDREWVRKIRACINARSEVLWQRFSGALGVPAGFDEEEEDMAIADDEEFSGDEQRVVGIGRTVHSGLAAHSPRDASVGVDNEQDLADSDSGFPNDDSEEYEDEYEDLAIIEPITASTLPIPSAVSGLASPLPDQSLTLSEGHALEDLREEEEEADSGVDIQEPAPAEVLGSESQDKGFHSPMPKRSPGLSTSPGQREYVPRTSSPLVASTTVKKTTSEEKATADESHAGRPSLHLSTPTSTLPPVTISHDPEEENNRESEIDFGEPDPNAEAIQGLRIMNAPMMLFASSPPGVPARMTDGEAFASSPATWTPPRSPLLSSHLAGIPAAPGTKQRTSSNSSSSKGSLMHPNLRAAPHHRTQSFGHYHSRRMSNSSTHMGSGHMIPPGGAAGHSLFPSSFAGMGTGPTSSVNNPRLRQHTTSSSLSSTPALGRHAGIPLGAGMHHTPRTSGALRQNLGLGGRVADYAVSESEQ